ncbi:MAG: Hpt domain-containing protein [Terracidiphilus sp.]|jgi:HPt (histidine-containing phosphotransfer) domain-containing protein
MEPAEHASLAEAMNRLWAQFLPQMEERVATLEAAAAALAERTLTAAWREQATSAAHKLAGVLGTFGLVEGTLLAREAEGFYSGAPAGDAAADGRPGEIASQLRAMLAARK